MANTFGGVTLTIRDRSISREDGADVSVRHIPGGSTSYVDLGGTTAPTLKMKLFFETFADYLTVAALVNTEDTLVYDDGTFTAVLRGLSLSDRFTYGEVLADASFVLTG